MKYFYLKDNKSSSHATFKVNESIPDQVHVTKNGDSPIDKVIPIDDARELWRELVRDGWRRVSRIYITRPPTPMPYKRRF